MAWSNGITEWIVDDTVYLSVVFSWKLPDAFQRSVWYKEQGYKVRAGGPGMFAKSLRSFLASVADISDGEIDAIVHHNPSATIASRGCPVGCYFCIVPKMEGKHFTFIPDFIPRKILCDNNLSALPIKYQEFIIDKYKRHKVILEDANSGFEPRTFDKGTYLRWREINRGPWRFAYDEEKEGADVYKVTKILGDLPGNKKRVYVMIGNEPVESCLERINKVIEWGCEPHVQPMIALNSLQKRPIVRFDWTEQRLRDMARWANRWLWRKLKFSEYSARIAQHRRLDEQR